MRLERIRAGDVVLCRIKGRSVYGEVLEVSNASAREIVSHWRKTGTRIPDADRDDQTPRPPLEQLSLPGVHT